MISGHGRQCQGTHKDLWNGQVVLNWYWFPCLSLLFPGTVPVAKTHPGEEITILQEGCVWPKSHPRREWCDTHDRIFEYDPRVQHPCRKDTFNEDPKPPCSPFALRAKGQIIL